VDAAGCYLPEVTQLSPDTVEISFVPSKETMDPVESRTITLNAGPKGDPGDPGPAPVRGVDYWTPDDVTAMESDISEKVTAAVAGKAQLKPEFAQTIGDCTDTSKLYVLPDGMIYAWMLTEVEVPGGPAYTNLLPTATDTDRVTIYNGKGYKENIRIDSSENEVSATGWVTTGFIPAKKNDIIRFKNCSVMDIAGANGSTSRCAFRFYDSNFSYNTVSGSFKPSNLPSSAWAPVYGADGDIVEINVPSSYSASIAYRRITMDDIDENSVITVNEEID
jgi:hypothetical protein